MLADYVRNVAYGIALTGAMPWLCYRGWRTGRYRQGWGDKLIGAPPNRLPNRLKPSLSTPSGSVRDGNGDRGASDDPPVVWLHGVSVGEVQLLKPLMEAMVSRRSDLRFTISTTTTTGMELAAKLFPPSVRKLYFPLDFSWSVSRTLRSLQPSLLVLGELELWPNLIAACQRRQIPIAVVNGRLSARSFRSYRRFRWLTESMFSGLDLVAVQDATYAQRFVTCGAAAAKVRTTGSLKFDNVEIDRNAAAVEQLRTLVGLEQRTAPVFLLGSSQGPEELASLDAYVAMRRSHPRLKLIIVPRHRERFIEAYQQLHRRLEQGQVSPPVRLLRRSQLTEAVSESDWNVLLVDTIGELRWWWGLSDLALVDGSFGSRGGQNMMEPAAYGASLAFGPRTENFRDIVDLLLAADAAERLAGVEGIEPWLRQQLASPAEAEQRGQRAQQLVVAQQGALERTVSELLSLLPKGCSQQHSQARPRHSITQEQEATV